jgi:hypothetical protein
MFLGIDPENGMPAKVKSLTSKKPFTSTTPLRARIDPVTKLSGLKTSLFLILTLPELSSRTA